MAQELADLRQRRAGTQHLHRRGVTQTMSMDPPEAGALGGGRHHVAHAAGAERAMRSLDADKYRPPRALAGRPLCRYSSHRFTDVPWQRNTFDTICFATHDDFAGSPIDVVESSLATSAARKPRRTSMVRIAKSRQPFRGVVAGRQQAPDLVRIQSLGQPSQSPTSDRWHGRDQKLLNNAVEMQEPEKDRSAVTVSFAAPRFCRGQRVTTKEMMSAAVRRSRFNARQSDESRP